MYITLYLSYIFNIIQIRKNWPERIEEENNFNLSFSKTVFLSAISQGFYKLNPVYTKMHSKIQLIVI